MDWGPNTPEVTRKYLDLALKARFTVRGTVLVLLAGVVPEVLRTQLYAVPALAGSALLVVLTSLEVTGPLPSVACAAFVFTVRMAALRWRWSAPRPPRSIP